MAKKCRICYAEDCDPTEHKLIRFVEERPYKYRKQETSNI